jgi:hypothetical protein
MDKLKPGQQVYIKDVGVVAIFRQHCVGQLAEKMVIIQVGDKHIITPIYNVSTEIPQQEQAQ